jgi:hypothetical protein
VGLPQEGDPYPGPMSVGEYITAADWDMLKLATLHQVMRQQDSDGKRILDVFAGKELGVMLEGDPTRSSDMPSWRPRAFPASRSRCTNRQSRRRTLGETREEVEERK